MVIYIKIIFHIFITVSIVCENALWRSGIFAGYSFKGILTIKRNTYLLSI